MRNTAERCYEKRSQQAVGFLRDPAGEGRGPAAATPAPATASTHALNSHAGGVTGVARVMIKALTS